MALIGKWTSMASSVTMLRGMVEAPCSLAPLESKSRTDKLACTSKGSCHVTGKCKCSVDVGGKRAKLACLAIGRLEGEGVDQTNTIQGTVPRYTEDQVVLV